MASTGIAIGIGFKVLLMALEWINPRYRSWQLTWKELVTDLFYVGLGYTVLRIVDQFIGSDAIIGLLQSNFDFGKLAWFTGLPMHNWYPLWLTHAPHPFITQLNINKGAVGNPVELFLIGLGIGGFFDFLPRAFLIAGTFGLAVSTYQHINVRFNTPRWWRFLFNTTEHHSVHHSLDYEATRSNYSGTWIIIDRMFGTCVDGEAEVLGMEGGRRMHIREVMHYPFSEAWKTLRAKFGGNMAGEPSAVPAE